MVWKSLSSQQWIWWVWVFGLVVWSYLLLTPGPAYFNRDYITPHTDLPITKFLHLCAYAFFTILAGTIQSPLKIGYLLLISLNAVWTEVFQQFVPDRHGCWEDMVLDHFGILVGLLLSWPLWKDAFLPISFPTRN